MKKILIPILALCASMAFANDVRTTKTNGPGDSMKGNGTLTEYMAGKTFIVKESGGPMTYGYGKTVVYATKGGKMLTEEQVRTRIKVGIPVWVHYMNEDGKRVISRVEVDDE